MGNQISEEVKKERLHRLNACSAETLKEGNRKYVGTSGTVLVEGCDKRGKETVVYGKLPNFKMVYFPGEEALIGTMCKVEITGTQNNSLIGTKIG